MKVEVYGESQPEEPKLRLRLKTSNSGNWVTLQVVDEDGERRQQGSLLAIGIGSGGRVKLRRCIAVNEAFGFRLDDCGRIVLDED